MAESTDNSSSPTDAELLQSGFRYALSLSHHLEDSEDLVQEAWLNLCKAYGGVESRAVLFTAVRHLFIDQCRRRKVLQFCSLEDWMLPLGSAAAIIALLGLFWLNQRGRVDFAALRPVVIAFFDNEPAYPLTSPRPEELRQWALAHGAPAGFRLPAKLQNLPGKGCTILDVSGKSVFLLCFMTVDATGKQDGAMVHLVIARRDDFVNAPRATTPALTAAGD